MHRPLFTQAAGLAVSASSRDRTLCVWRLSDGTCLRTLAGHTAGVHSVVDAGGGRIASVGSDSTLRVWDALSGQQLQQISIAEEDWGEEDPEEYNFCIAALPGGRVATGRSHGEIRLWRLGEGGGAAGALEGHGARVNDLVLMGGGRAQPLLASASDDGTVRLWDVDAAACVAVLDGHGRGAWDLADLGGGRLLSVCFDAVLRVWDVSAAACLATVEHEEEDFLSLTDLGGGRIASGDEDGRLRIWEWNAANKTLAQEGEPLAGHTDLVTAVVHVGAGAAQQLLSGSDDCTLRLWRRDSSGAWAETAVLRGHTGRVDDIALVCARQPADPG